MQNYTENPETDSFEGGPFDAVTGTIFNGSAGYGETIGTYDPITETFTPPEFLYDPQDLIQLNVQAGVTYTFNLSSSAGGFYFSLYDPNTDENAYSGSPIEFYDGSSYGFPPGFSFFSFGTDQTLTYTASYTGVVDISIQGGGEGEGIDYIGGLQPYTFRVNSGHEEATINEVETTSGDDNLTGTDGDDIANLGNGEDKIITGAGNDSVHGGSGEDTILGGEGADTLQGGNDDDHVSGGAGDDEIAGGSGRDQLNGGDGADSMHGGNGNDKLLGGEGNDTLDGASNNDRLFGDAGDDMLLGGAGNDKLFGGTGADTLDGGTGKDELTGGSGADVFVFGLGSHRDTIKDFEDGIDQIDLSAYGFTDITDFIIVSKGDDVELQLTGADRILIKDISVTDLDASDFIFA